MSDETPPVRVLVAVGYALLRDGLRRLVADEERIAWVGEAADAAEAVRRSRELRPDVLLLGVPEPGLEALRALSSDDVFPRTLLLAAQMQEGDLADALELGARGWISGDAGAASLFKAIHAVVAGEYWVGRDVVSRLLDLARREAVAGDEAAGGPLEALTPRERDILEAVASGESNRVVAERLGLAEPTVKHHLTRIFEKLGVGSRAELIAALGRGLGARRGDRPGDSDSD